MQLACLNHNVSMTLRAYPKNPGKEWGALSESPIHLRSSV
jgi:hypothetical protein